jgi:hypothetical protein
MDMDNKEFAIKLLRFIGAELHVSISMYAARELFGQSLFALSSEQRTELNNRLHEFVSPAFRF